MIKKKIQKDNRTIFIIAPFIGIQILILLFLGVAFLANIGHSPFFPKYVISFSNEDVTTEPPSSCLETRNSSAQISHSIIFVSSCNLSNKIRINNGDSDFYWSIGLDLGYKDGKIFAYELGEEPLFYTTPKEDYILTIPVEFEKPMPGEPKVVMLNVKLYILFPEHRIYWLFIFSPTILLITILIIRRLRKKS